MGRGPGAAGGAGGKAGPPGWGATNSSITRNLPINGVTGDSDGIIFRSARHVGLPTGVQDQLRELFPKSAPKKVTEAEETANKVLQILDPNRERNVGIVLKFIRLPVQQIEASVRTFDTLTMGEEHIAGLLKVIPTPEDMEAIGRARKDHGGPWTKEEEQNLSPAVRFFLMTEHIDHYAERIHAWSLKFELQGRIDYLEEKLQKALDAEDAVFHSTHLPDMLYFLLEVSNFLNTGSRFQGAKGFPITQLPHIMDFKTTDGKSTLLQYVVETLDRVNPSLHEVTNELMPAVDQGKDIDVPSIHVELKKLRGRLQKCKQLIEHLSNDRRWTNVLGKFIYKSLPELERVEKILESVEAKTERLQEFLCEKKETFSLNEVLRILSNFCKRYAQEREKQDLRRERQARMEANKERREGEAPRPPSGGKESSDRPQKDGRQSPHGRPNPQPPKEGNGHRGSGSGGTAQLSSRAGCSTHGDDPMSHRSPDRSTSSMKEAVEPSKPRSSIPSAAQKAPPSPRLSNAARQRHDLGEGEPLTAAHYLPPSALRANGRQTTSPRSFSRTGEDGTLPPQQGTTSTPSITTTPKSSRSISSEGQSRTEVSGRSNATVLPPVQMSGRAR